MMPKQQRVLEMSERVERKAEVSLTDVSELCCHTAASEAEPPGPTELSGQKPPEGQHQLHSREARGTLGLVSSSPAHHLSGEAGWWRHHAVGASDSGTGGLLRARELRDNSVNVPEWPRLSPE